jgi:hypothetical protein
MSDADATMAHWLELIQSEYCEIPGLQLTKPQMQRLWSLDSLLCDLLLHALIDVGFLRRTDGGAYVRAGQRGVVPALRTRGAALDQ